MSSDTPAKLMKWPSLHGERISPKDGAQPYTISQGTLGECIGSLQAKPAASLHLYEIRLSDGSVVSADEAIASQQPDQQAVNDPTFTIEEDKVGLGYCVVVQWQDGRREVVTGFGDHHQATRWTEVDSAKWLLDSETGSRTEGI